MVVALALISSAIIGASDYLGGRASQRSHPLWVTAQAQSVNAAVVAIAAVIFGTQGVRGGDLGLGALGGIGSGIAYGVFFWGLTRGRVAVIAPVTAVVTAVGPVLVDLVAGTALSTWRWVGIAVTIVAIPLVAAQAGTSTRSLSTAAEIAVSVGGGIGFAGFFVTIGRTDTASGLWPAVVAALVSAIVAVVAMGAMRTPRSGISRLALIGGASAGVASAAITAALQIGPLAVATVLGSLYPIVTTGLAARLDLQRPGRINVIGIGLAVVGAALVAAA